MSILREEVFGAIKMLTRLAHMNPSVSIDIMNYYHAMYYEIFDVQCISFVCTQ
jgi:hypothetical protein